MGFGLRVRAGVWVMAVWVVGAGGLGGRAWGQTTAAMRGTVVDQTGARVAGAAVTVRGVGRGLERHTTTDAEGRYALPGLGLGDYAVEVSKAGFERVVRRGVDLVVGQDAVVDVRLRVGAVGDQVTVQGDAPMVSATTADVSGLVHGEQIRNLPLNGRSFDLLMTLNPGVVNFTSAKVGGTGVSNSTNGNNFAVSGNRPQQNLFLLNGVELTGAAENNMQPGGVSGQLLGVDAVEEFNVLRDDYGAEYGKRPGAQVVLVTRRGTNTLHGSVYEFLRNNVLDAANYFDPGSAPGFQRNQYGAAVGGAIRKDRTFGFVNFEGLNQRLHQTGVDLVPDSNAIAGYLPCGLVTPKPAPCAGSGLAFVGVSPLVAAWPKPTPGAPDFGGIAEALNTPLQVIRDDFGTARVDQVLGAADTLNGVYTIDDSGATTPTSTNLYSTDVETLREQVASASETHVFSTGSPLQGLLNEATVGFSRASYFFTGEPTPGTPAAALPGFLAGKRIGALVVGGSATSNPTAQLSLAGSNNGSNLDVHRNLFTYEDHVALTRGRNNYSAGVWLQRFESNETLALSQYGQATFTSLQTLLEGTASSLVYDPAPTEMNWRAYLGAWFVEDSVRVRPQLTATLGFRGESSSGWNEAHGRASNYSYPNGVIASQPTVGDSVFTKNYATFLPEPRVGLAYSPSGLGGRTVVKAGFGIYDDLQDALGYRTDQNAPYNPTYSLPNAKVSELPLIPSAAAPTGAKLVPGGVQPDLRTPRLISYTVAVEQELGKNTALRIAYVGSHGYHELIGVDANEPAPVVCPSAACPVEYPASFPVGIAGTTVPAGTYYVPTAVRANPALANTWTYFSRGDSGYNALQVDLNHRFSDGLSFRGVYTWSRAIDDGDSLNSTTSGGEPATVANPYNLRADRGLANYDARNVAVLNEVYQLPFGHGRRYGAGWNGWENGLAGGWLVASDATIQSGFPFTPQLSYNPSNNGDTRNPVRPFVNPKFAGNAIEGKPTQWFNPSAFVAPPANSGFYGNLGRDTLIGPGLGAWDVAFAKDTAVREGVTVEVRAEEFNVLNRANFNQPNAVVFTPTGVSPTAGVITGTSTSSRQTQVALKLLF
jgi:hypothetical protein